MINADNIWNNYLYFVFFLGVAFFLISLVMLYWSLQRGQFLNFHAQAESIFDKNEPIGLQTDFFPANNSSDAQRPINHSPKL